MTSRESNKYIDKHGYLNTEGLKVRVLIIDAKSAYGNLLLLVTPSRGSGEKWVSLSRVHIPLHLGRQEVFSSEENLSKEK